MPLRRLKIKDTLLLDLDTMQHIACKNYPPEDCTTRCAAFCLGVDRFITCLDGKSDFHDAIIIGELVEDKK